MRGLFFLLILAGISWSGDERQSYDAKKIRKLLKIDGKIDEKEWRRVSWTQEFRDIEGGQRPKPRYATRAKMMWDDEYLYVAAELEEPDLWASYDRHDMVIFHENDFEVFLDPDGDGLHYFEFEMNALNTGWDLYLAKPYKDGGKAEDDWEMPGLKTAVHLMGTLNDPRDRDRGWTLEMAIPWRAFDRGPRAAVPPKPGQQWRVNFSRVEWGLEVIGGKYRKKENLKEDNWVWSVQGLINMHVPEKWGQVRFVD
ncbi:MAG: carbohydrate-binding family 9-like protein [Bryobacter sp.]|jgi:hypothetical protein|nr:carbohydrate-binding family 9-like protein [Bryobacter sp. CoA8 C33]